MAARKERPKYVPLTQRLEAAVPPPPPPAPAPAAGEPEEIVCPFTGKPLKIQQVKTSYPGVFSYLAVGEFWTSRSYPTVRQLKWVLCHRDGVAPAFGPSSIERVRHLEAPAPSAVADQLAKDEQVEKNALDMIGRTMESGTDRKIFVQPGGLKS